MMSAKLIISVILVSLVGMISSCKNMPMGPESKAHAADKSVSVPASFSRASGSSPVPEVARGLQSLFSDDRLNGYVRDALVGNPDLQTSLANLEEAGFNTRKSYAPRLVSLSGSGTLGRRGSDGNSSGVYSATLDASWEVDVWGRIRAGVQAVSRDQAALAADHAAARESIAAQTMQAYFSLIASEKLLALSERRLSSFEKTVALVSRRFESGTGSLSDVDLARTDVENTRAEVEGRKDGRDQAARQLAVLTGKYPSSSARVKSYPSLRGSVPAGVPSTVMMKRPDIHAAYERILAADARVTVAHRDLYPSFPLTASVGQESNILKSLADSNFSVWSILANVTGPILDGGERRSELGAANARAKRALSVYRATVLDAFEEVENALGSEYYLERQQRSYSDALSAARSAESRTRSNYERGLVEILSLLEAQRRSFTTEEALINTEAQRYSNRVSLALALGQGL